MIFKESLRISGPLHARSAHINTVPPRIPVISMHFAKMKSIFCEALEVDSAEERTVYLREACAGDAGLLAEIEELLGAHEEAGDFLDGRTPDWAMASGTTPLLERAGTSIGRYKLLEQIAEGGMGVVYVAEQQSPIVRKVALKIIKPGLDTREVIARFEMERQVLALMNHPHIAHVLDVGTTDSGRPYFVMELVPGIPITEFCDQHHLSTHERLELFVQVCHAIQHAHQKGIIHRDVKPSNVLVIRQDDRPVPKVIDFGVAKAIDQRPTGRTAHTRFAQMIGTPLYMSPEQAELGADVDTRSDVYSLGVLLYELLTGVTPFEFDRLRSASFDEMRRIVREEEPPRPSVRVTTLRATCTSACPKCRGEPRRLSHTLRGELDCIVMTAIDKDRTRRYDSAGSLAADVLRYLNNEPIQARPATVFRHAYKWLRRHPALAFVILALHACGAIVLCGAMWHFYQMSVALAVSTDLRTESQLKEIGLRSQLYATDVGLAWQAWTEGDLSQARELLERHRPQGGAADLRGFEWYLLNGRMTGELKTYSGHEAPILAAAVSLDDRWIVSGDRGGGVRLWNFATGRARKVLHYGDQEVTSVCFSPDGRTLATAGQDQTVRLWNTVNWQEMASLRGHTGTICCVAWSPDGKQLASAGRDRAVKIWDAATYREIRTLPDHADVVRCVAWSPDGKTLSTGGAESTVRLWDTETWSLKARIEGHVKGVLSLAFSSNGIYLAFGGYGHQLIVHDISRGAELARTETPGSIWSLAFSPDGALLMAGAADGLLSVFSARNLDRGLERIRGGVGHKGRIRAVLFAQQGRTFITASEDDRTLKSWRVADLTGRRTYSFQGEVLAVATAGDSVAMRDGPLGLRLARFPMETAQRSLCGHSQEITNAAFSPDGRLLAAPQSTGQVQLWDIATQPCRHRSLSPEFPVHTVAFSPDSAVLAGGGEGGAVSLWQVGQESPGITLRGTSLGWVETAFSPDGTLLATASMSGPEIDVWCLATQRRLFVLHSSQPVASLAFSSDGSTIVAGGEYGGVSLLDLVDRRERVVLRGHESQVVQLAFSHDGRTLASLDGDATVRLWHMPTRRALFTLLRHNRPLNWIAFASNRRLLVGVTPDPNGRGEVLEFDAAAIAATTKR
jgi:WD40 repeat protein/serine/threonine protein kinase